MSSILPLLSINNILQPVLEREQEREGRIRRKKKVWITGKGGRKAEEESGTGFELIDRRLVYESWQSCVSGRLNMIKTSVARMVAHDLLQYLRFVDES